MSTKEEIYYLAFGSNMGNRKEIIEKAIEMLEEDMVLINKSSYYLTEPWGDKNQDWFTNCVASFKAYNLAPYSLLEKIHKIEYTLHRVRDNTNRNAQRTIDIDILDAKHGKISGEDLTIPHERMFQRAFVLVPLKEIEPNYSHEGKNIDTLLAQIDYRIEEDRIYQD